ncbi:hypothetical protein [Synechocystis sp. CACIAM 05]|uniref:hypothetical protein n=1 Tax=Synechocystis sp. CACIAM 05 TaxID=1933929 RepID=UPI001F22D67C|nr:hypothetical protein [Synechocystis sp. CACIAM 05]
MDFVEAEQMYYDWCQQLQERHISATEFTAWLDRLRVQDDQGNWWRIEHPGGVWLCWNGQAWERKNPPKEATDSPPGTALTQQMKEPQNLGQLLGWLAGSVLKGIPKQIVLGIFLIVIVWLLHLFLLVVVNDGFNLTGTNPWFDSVLVLGGEVIAGSLFWIFTGILLSQLIHGTLGQYLKAITSFPATVVSFCQQSSQFKAPILWLGFSGALVFALLFGNLLVSLQILLFTLVALQESTHFLRLVLKLSWQDAQKLIRKGKSLHPLTSDQCQQLLSGMAVGFGLAALLLWLAPSLLRLFFIAAIAVTLWQFFSGKRSTTSALSLFIIFTAGSLTLGQMEPVWADDGGWAECGQSLQTWIRCGGTDQAILNSGLAGLAIWLGWILGGLQIPSASVPSSGVISTTPGATTFPQDIEYTYPDGRHTTLVYDPEKGGYINILTGGWIDPNEINAWHQNNLSTHQQTEDWRRRNEYLEATGQDVQSQALATLQAKQKQERSLRDTYEKLLEQVQDSDIKNKDKIEQLVKKAARLDDKGIPQGNLQYIQRFISHQQQPNADYGTFDQIWDVTKGTLTGTGKGVLNVVSLGFSGVVEEHYDKGDLLSSLSGHTANLVTFGGYKGYQEGGLSGAGYGIIKTLVPIEEFGTVFLENTSWDQKAGAIGSGILKFITLGKAGGKLISSRPITPKEIGNIKYGYHFTDPKNTIGILKSGLEARAPGSHGTFSNIVSKIARPLKNCFVDNEPPKAAYMFGSSKPGLGRLGDIDCKNPPIVIDLSKIDPKNLMVRPSDGAIVFTGKNIPPSALSAPSQWSQVPISSTPLQAQPLANLPQALTQGGRGLYTNNAAQQAFQDLYKK